MASTTLVSSGSGGNNFEDFERDLEALLRDHQEQQQQQQQQLRRAGGGGGGLLGRPRGDLLDIHRSGSAPPTVEGSLSAIGSLFGGSGLAEHDLSGALTEEEIRAHPEYLSYYYSNGNFNPRLPPPVLSREDWRAVQRFRGPGSAFGGIGDRRTVKDKTVGQVASSSLFSLQPVGTVRDRDGVRVNDREATAEWSGSVGSDIDGSMQGAAKWAEHAGDGFTGLPAVGSGGRRMSFADASQEELGRPNYVAGHGSLSSGCTLNDVIDPRGIRDAHTAQRPNDCETVDALSPGTASPGLVRVQSLQSLGSSLSHPIASAQGSSFALSADPQLLRRYPSPCLPSMRSNFPSDDMSSSFDRDHIAAALAGMNLSTTESFSKESHLQRQLHPEFIEEVGGLFNDARQYLDQNGNNPESELVKIHPNPVLYKDSPKKNGYLRNHKLSKIAADGQNYLHKRSSLSLPLAAQSGFEGSSTQSNGRSRGSNMNGFLVHNQPPEIRNDQLNGGGTYEGGQESNYLTSFESQVGSGLRDPLYAQYLNKMDATAQTATLKGLGPGRNFPEASLLDASEYKKAYHRVLLEQHKLQSGMPFLGDSVGLIHGYYDNGPALDLGLPYSPNPLHPSLGSGGSIRQSDRLPRVTSLGRSATAGPFGSWNSENSIREAGFGSSLLGEFKTNKTRNFELLDIVNHVVEFSADQYGSRFIQQKLETASVEEKNKIFPEILPCARVLMTDVFGNYVIQKFFEHGTKSQRMQLASQLTGHVLDLSLQMYGCRVIQKALEVVDLEHQTQMVSELDGSVMKCVRDQNGNHVIQKCIECVPQERIQFIISCFYGQVVTLSTHPYGCRVIQRVLEHCHDLKTQDIMMQEILASVSTLAQDQYGNYVVQHVLQHGKPVERSAIISKLVGNIVDMSLQKFASNVIEKCLTHGSPEERQLLINEMLGTTDENEPLQALMKDQYGNYVVQKVIETCDDKNRELIVSRIKVHLNALKKYTYGKHIVARVEKLVATGERHSRGC